MALHIVIDGYNLICQSKTFGSLDTQDIQSEREVLVNRLGAYKKIKRHKITVVFDGTNAPFFSSRRDRLKGIDILFSRNGETADAVIKRIATKEREKALVVSSDRDVVVFSERQGAATVSSTDFEKRIELAAYNVVKEAEPEDENGSAWVPSTKKKGPSKRLSKKNRKSRIKLRKL